MIDRSYLQNSTAREWFELAHKLLTACNVLLEAGHLAEARVKAKEVAQLAEALSGRISKLEKDSELVMAGKKI